MSDNNTQEVIIKVSADTSGLEQGINESKNKMTDLGNTPVDKSIKSLKTQLKESVLEAEKLGQQFGRNSQEFVNAAKKVADMRDAIEENNAAFKAFNPDNKLQAVVGVARTAATAVQGVGGAMSFLGVESETALQTMAKLQGIMAFTDALNSIGDLTDFWKGFVLQLKSARAATQAQAAATEGATVATRGLGLAFKAIGIGLLISAIAYLVSNWRELKDSVVELFPSLQNAGKLFDNFKQIAMGVGNTILQFVVAPIKVLIKTIQLDFKGAIAEMEKGFDIVKNFQAGANKEFLKQEQDKLNASVQNKIKAVADEIDLAKAQGKETYRLEKENNQRKLSLLKNGSEEYKQVLKDDAILTAKHLKDIDDKRKQAADKASQQRTAEANKKRQEDEAENKRELDEIKASQTETRATIAAMNKSAKALELGALTDKFNSDLALYMKHGKDIIGLTLAYNIQRAGIENKYNNIIEDYMTDTLNKNLDVYEQKKIEINKKIAELWDNATDDQKKKLLQLKQDQLADIDKEKNLNTVSIKAETNLINTETNNVITEGDSPETIKEKLNNVYNARVEVENANFDEEKNRLRNNKEELAKLEAQHNQNILNIQRDAQQEKQAIDDAERESKLALYDQIGNGLGQLGNLFKKNSAAAKVAALAEIAINTSLGFVQGLDIAQKSAKAAGPGAAFAFPIFYASQVAAVLGAAAKARSILGAASGGDSGGSSGSSFAAPQAPSINVNQLSDQKVQDVRVTNTQDTIVKAYITERDLKDQQQKQDFMEKMKI